TGGLLHGPVHRRQQARDVFRQHLPGHRAVQTHRGSHRVPRGHPRAPLPDQPRPGAGGHPAAAPGQRLQRLRRRLGPLHRALGSGDGVVLRRRGLARHAEHGFPACRAAGGGHRPARQGLEQTTGDRLPAREQPDAGGGDRGGGRSLHRLPGPGAVLHGRPPGDPADAQGSAGTHGRTVRHRPVPRRGAGQRSRSAGRAGRPGQRVVQPIIGGDWGPREEIASAADEPAAGRFERYPIEASLLGRPGPHHRLTDYAEQARQRPKNAVPAIARAATAVDPTVLTEEERITRELIVQQAVALAAEIEVRSEEFSVSDGLSSPALWPLVALPITTVTDGELAEGYLERLAALPRYLETMAERQRAGVEHGLAPPGFLVRGGIAYVERYLNAHHDPLRAVTPQVEVSGFEQRRDALVTDVVRPAYARYRQFLVDELLPAARPDGQSGLWWQPEGETRYAALIRVYTTTDRPAEELHQSGLDILDKLNAEYAALGKKVFGTTSIDEIFQRLRTDPGLRWTDGDEMLRAARDAIVRAEKAVPSWFGHVPTNHIEVRPVPPAEASGGSTAFYTPPPLDGSRPGIYNLNVTDAQQRYRYLSEAIAFHEAIPGHHFQVTTARGLRDLP